MLHCHAADDAATPRRLLILLHFDAAAMPLMRAPAIYRRAAITTLRHAHKRRHAEAVTPMAAAYAMPLLPSSLFVPLPMRMPPAITCFHFEAFATLPLICRRFDAVTPKRFAMIRGAIRATLIFATRHATDAASHAGAADVADAAPATFIAAHMPSRMFRY